MTCLGIDLPLLDLLPEDPRTDGFDTVSSGQQISHFQLEKYLDVADTVLDAAVERALGESTPTRIEVGWPELKTLSKGKRQPVPRPEQKDVVSWSPSRAFSGRMPPTKVQESGWYRISLRVSAVNPPADGQVWCSVHSGVCASNAPTLFWIGSFPAITEEREIEFRAWIEAGHMLEVRRTIRPIRKTSSERLTRPNRRKAQACPAWRSNGSSSSRFPRV